MKKFNLGEISKLAWKIRKEAAKKFNCKIMEILWGECFAMAREELEGNIAISFQEWFADYETNQKTYSYILYHSEIIGKNGRFTESQELEAKTTSATWQILPGEEEDIRQEALAKLMELFSRKEILWKQRYYIWSLACFNAIKQANRNRKRCGITVAPEDLQNYRCRQEETTIYGNNSSVSILKLDMERALDEEQLKLVFARSLGYKKYEIADAFNVSRPTLNKRINKIQKIVREECLL